MTLLKWAFTEARDWVVMTRIMVSMSLNVKRLLDQPDTDSAATELPPWWWAAQGREQLTGHAAD
jgi:hypothetical protein